MKYLIYCGPGIGDWILILPMARTIKKNDSHAHITAIMTSDKNKFKLNKTLLAIQNEIDDIDYYSIREIAHIPSFLIHIGIKKFDYGFVLQYTDNEITSKWPSKIINIASKKSCGIKIESNPSIHYDFEVSRLDGTRIVDYPMIMLEKVGIEKNIHIDYENLIDKNIILKEVNSLGIDNKKEKYISLVVGAAPISGVISGKYISNFAKNWAYSNWIELAKRFNNKGYKILLLGGLEEQEELKKIGFQEEIEDSILNLTGKCNIIQSLAALCCSCLVIGSDTGLMHCAGALNIPSLTLFGCTDYREYLPFGKKSTYITSEIDCSPCFGTKQSFLCKNVNCMKKLTVSQVYEKAIGIMENNFG